MAPKVVMLIARQYNVHHNRRGRWFVVSEQGATILWRLCVWEGKMSPFPKKDVKIIPTKIGDIVHTNLCGPFSSKSMGGASYDISLKYDHS